MGPVTATLSGLKPLRPATLFEMAAIAITEQQLSLAAAFHIRARLVKRFGTPLDGLWIFPVPRKIAVHKQSQGRRLRIVDSTHLDGVAGRNGAVCRPAIVTPTVPGSSPLHSLLRPLAEYEAVIGGSF